MKTYLNLADLGDDVEAEVEYNYCQASNEPSPYGISEYIEVTKLDVKLDGENFITLPVNRLSDYAYDRILDEISGYERRFK